MRRNRRVFLSRTPSIRRVLMLKDVVADGLLGKATARSGWTSTHQQMHFQEKGIPTVANKPKTIKHPDFPDYPIHVTT